MFLCIFITIHANCTDYEDGQGGEDLDVPMFELSAIIKATDNFSDENKLGEGGFGPVYKVLIQNQDWLYCFKMMFRTCDSAMRVLL